MELVFRKVADFNFVKNGLNHKFFCFPKVCRRYTTDQNPNFSQEIQYNMGNK